MYIKYIKNGGERSAENRSLIAVIFDITPYMIISYKLHPRDTLTFSVVSNHPP